MSSTRTIVTDVRTRSWRDIDPKVAAGAVIAGLVTLVLGTLLVAGRLTGEQFITTVGAVWGVVSAGYLKRSSEDTTAQAAAETAADVLEVAGPVVQDALPEAAPVIRQIHDSAQLIGEIAARPAAAVDAAVSPQA